MHKLWVVQFLRSRCFSHHNRLPFFPKERLSYLLLIQLPFSSATLWALLCRPRTRRGKTPESWQNKTDSTTKADGKAKIDKWSKGKFPHKPCNVVLFDRMIYDKLSKEVLEYKLVVGAELWFLSDWRFAAPWPEQHFRSYLIKDL